MGYTEKLLKQAVWQTLLLVISCKQAYRQGKYYREYPADESQALLKGNEASHLHVDLWDRQWIEKSSGNS